MALPGGGGHLLREPQPHALPGRGDLNSLLLALPVPARVTHGPASACCQPEPRSSEWPQDPTGGSGLSVCGWRLWTLSGPGWGQDIPPRRQTGAPHNLGWTWGQKDRILGLCGPWQRAHRGHLLTPDAVSVLCDGGVGGGEPGGEEPQRGHPRAWSLRGGPWGVELQLAEPPWGHSDQAHCPLQGGFLALGKVRVPALCGPGVLGEKALAGLC